MAGMRRAILIGLALTCGCSKAPTGAGKAQEAAPAAAMDAKQPASAIKVSVPQIAYTYQYLFRLPTAALARTQDRHIAMCDQMGLAQCHVLEMQRAAGEGSIATGSLKLVVASGIARRFGSALSSATTAAGGEQFESSIEAEDLSKQIVDTDARLRAKQALANRLMALLNTRTGSVADLVAAERAVADVQEEIDAAQSWLADARGRVAMSTLQLNYQSDAAWGGGLAPLAVSVRNIGSLFGQSLAALIAVLAALLPWAILGGAIYAGWRYARRRMWTGRASDER